MFDVGGFRPPRLSVNDSADQGLGVLLVDRIPLFRAGLSALITHTDGLRWLGSTDSVDSAMMLCAQLHPDIVLVAAMLDPRGRLVRGLVTRYPTVTVAVLMCAGYRNDTFVHQAATAAGAHGVLSRSAEPAQLLEGSRRAHRERRYIDPELSMVGGGSSRTRRPESRRSLSRREYQVLQLIADGMDNQTIGRALFVSVETVRTHVKSILRKLHARDRAHAVSLAYRTGVLVTQAEPGIDADTAAGAARSGQRATVAAQDSAPAHASAAAQTRGNRT